MSVMIRGECAACHMTTRLTENGRCPRCVDVGRCAPPEPGPVAQSISLVIGITLMVAGAAAALEIGRAICWL